MIMYVKIFVFLFYLLSYRISVSWFILDYISRSMPFPIRGSALTAQTLYFQCFEVLFIKDLLLARIGIASLDFISFLIAGDKILCDFLDRESFRTTAKFSLNRRFLRTRGVFIVQDAFLMAKDRLESLPLMRSRFI